MKMGYVVGPSPSWSATVLFRLTNLAESDEEDYTGGDSHLVRVMKE
jgi:hypothetical protein